MKIIIRSFSLIIWLSSVVQCQTQLITPNPISGTQFNCMIQKGSFNFYPGFVILIAYNGQ
jgi:hypothetical protein